MKIISKTIELEPPKGVDKLIISYDPDKGWLLRFTMGKDLGGEKCYTVTRDVVIYGVFIAMQWIPKLQPEEYLWRDSTEQRVLNRVKNLTLKNYKTWAEQSVVEDPILTQLKSMK